MLRYNFKPVSFLVFTLCMNVPLHSWAQDSTANNNTQKHSIRIDFDQDVLLEYLGMAKQNEDRNYTQGLGLHIGFPKLGFCVGKKLFENKETRLEYYQPLEIGAAIAGFTPDDLRDSMPIIGDRPYFSTLLGKFTISRLLAEEAVFQSRSFYVGVIGVHGPASKAQTAIHVKTNQGNTRPPWNPMGWHNQISDSKGGEWTGLLTVQRSWLSKESKNIFDRRVEDGNRKPIKYESQVSYYRGWNVGYIMQVFCGVQLKLGKLDWANWHSDLFNQMAAMVNAGGETGEDGQPKQAAGSDKIRAFFNQKKVTESYWYVSVTPQLTFYNAALHGQFFKTAYRLPYWQTGFVNAQARFGRAFSCPWFSFSIYVAVKTPEMWNTYARLHEWGGATLGFKW